MIANHISIFCAKRSSVWIVDAEGSHNRASKYCLADMNAFQGNNIPTPNNRNTISINPSDTILAATVVVVVEVEIGGATATVDLNIPSRQQPAGRCDLLCRDFDGRRDDDVVVVDDLFMMLLPIIVFADVMVVCS